MPMSAVWHARWSNEQPSKQSSTSLWSSLVLTELIELAVEALCKESPVMQLEVRSRTETSGSCKSIAFARVNEVLNDACPCTAFTSASESIMRR